MFTTTLTRLPTRLLSAALLLSLAAASCSFDTPLSQPPHSPWTLLEPLPLSPTPLDFDPAPAQGLWRGPEQVGGCVAVARWLEMDDRGLFTYGQFSNSDCEGGVAVSRCEGRWRLDEVTRHEAVTSGKLSYACEASEGSSESAPVRRALSESTFAILSDEGSARELTTMAFEWAEDGAAHRRYEEEIVYEGGFSGAERSRSRIETRLELVFAETGERIERGEQLLERAQEVGRVVAVEVRVELTGEAELAPFNVAESGEEVFKIAGVVTRTGADRMTLRLSLSGDTDFEAWSRHLGDQGVFARYTSLGATLSVGMTRTLYWRGDAPRMWWGAGAWREASGDACSNYGMVVSALCDL